MDAEVKDLLTRIETSIGKLEKAEETVVNASKVYEKHATDPLAHANLAWLKTRDTDGERLSEFQLVLSEIESQLSTLLNRVTNIETEIVQMKNTINQKHGE